MEELVGMSVFDCYIHKYQEYVQAQRRWQEKLTKLIIETAPQYKEVAFR